MILNLLLTNSWRCRKKLCISQTHFCFANMGSDLLCSQGKAHWKSNFWSWTPCSWSIILINKPFQDYSVPNVNNPFKIVIILILPSYNLDKIWIPTRTNNLMLYTLGFFVLYLMEIKSKMNSDRLKPRAHACIDI